MWVQESHAGAGSVTETIPIAEFLGRGTSALWVLRYSLAHGKESRTGEGDGMDILSTGSGGWLGADVPKRERGAATGSPSQAIVVRTVGTSAGRCQRFAPQERCFYATTIPMPGGVATPPVGISFLYTRASQIARHKSTRAGA